MEDLKDRHIVITGATSGIGYEAARVIVQTGATVVLISRNKQKLESVSADLIKQSGNEQIDWIQADLSSLASTRAAAATYLARYARLDVLVNNAGAYFSERKESVDGIEMTIALNHVGPFVLTNALLPLLTATAAQTGDSRIVNVSSDAHRTAKFNWVDLEGKQKFSGWGAYSVSKAMNVLHANELARRLADTGVTANSLHPGAVNTSFGNETSGITQKIFRFVKRFVITPEQGAQTTIHLATATEVQGITGKYWVKSAQKAPTATVQDEAAQEKLWTMSEQWAAAQSG